MLIWLSAQLLQSFLVNYRLLNDVILFYFLLENYNSFGVMTLKKKHIRTHKSARFCRLMFDLFFIYFLSIFF